MSFDKNKAMRNAERFLSQGKIRAAINEYQRVVENDPKDFSTLNILGDLHAKNRDKQQALGCFTQVAEHYNTQGFSHKAIAVYNKISRIEPGSIEISAKLAELYQSKGSIAEARQHYQTLAEHYQKQGQKAEALATWKQIAELDPNNTEIYTKIAETCLQEGQTEEATRAFTEAGMRFIIQMKFEPAMASFTRALQLKEDDLRALKGLVKSQIGLGYADEAAHTLEEVLETQPHNRDVLYLLVDCYLDMNNAPQAESAVNRLVEQEPTSYLKYLDLVKIYLKSGDLEAATRILSRSAEHLLVGGQSEEFLEWTNEILARNPEHVNALRLLVRYYGWQRSEVDLKESLERLAEAARLSEAAEDEHYALAQLTLMAPHQEEYARRLQQLSAAYGLGNQYGAPPPAPGAVEIMTEIPQYQNLDAADNLYDNGQNGGISEFDFADLSGSYDFDEKDSTDETKEFAFYNGGVGATVVEDVFETHNQSHHDNAEENSNSNLTLTDDARLQKEVDSIEYYIEQGYFDLADKSLNDLEAEFGTRIELTDLRNRLNETTPPETFKPESAFSVEPAPSAEIFVPPTEPNVVETIPAQMEPAAEKIEPASGFDIGSELRSELDAHVSVPPNRDDDYETHYHLGTAYKEMDLMENAIREFQDAIVLVDANDGTRRFFQCANHLGHCFMEKQMPKAAAKWFLRDLEVADLTDEEKQAIFYDLGDAFEAGGETEKALSYFEQLYAENIDYRDVGERLENLQGK